MKIFYLLVFGLIYISLNNFGQTNVSGHITSDTTWRLAGSPYNFAGPVTVDSLATLHIEPGVALIGNNETLIVLGTLNAIGNDSSMIKIENLLLLGKTSESKRKNYINLEFVAYSFNYNDTLQSYYLNTSGFVLKRSFIENWSNGRCWVNADTLFIEKNIFTNSTINLQGSSIIMYNMLIGGMFFSDLAHFNYNSIFGGLSGISMGVANIPNNYWGGTDIDEIKRNYRIGLMVNLSPVLIDHDPNTPIFADFNADKTLGFDSLSVNFTINSKGYHINKWHWDFGDGDTSNFESGTHIYRNVGNYTVKLFITNGIYTYTQIKEAFINIVPSSELKYEKPVLGFTQNMRITCLENPVYFTDTTSGNVNERLWYFPGGSPLYAYEGNPSVTYNTPGIYPVTLVIKSVRSLNNKYIIPYTDSITKTSWITVKPVGLVTSIKPLICMATVNDLNQNVIVWEKIDSNVIYSNLIYRESTSQTNLFELIGESAYASQSVFVDTLSNAKIQSNTYRIAYKDFCGNISYNSEDRTTVHLNVYKGLDASYNLLWEEYKGVQVTNYNIYRGSTIEDMKLIGSTGDGHLSYSDYSAPTGTVYYYVEIILPQTCSNPTGNNNSRSNIVSNKISTEVSENKSLEELTLYPIPANDILIVIYHSLKNPTATISTMEGKIEMKIKLQNTGSTINIEGLPRGLFILQVADYQNTYIRKFIKE